MREKRRLDYISMTLEGQKKEAKKKEVQPNHDIACSEVEMAIILLSSFSVSLQACEEMAK